MKQVKKWKKRAAALFLAVILACSGGLETAGAMEDTGGQPAEQAEDFYTITLDLAGGESEGELSLQVPAGEIPDKTLIEDPVRTGYTFLGWVFEDKTLYLFTHAIDEDVTLYAWWNPITYQVDFTSEDGEGEMPGLTAIYDTPLKLPYNTFYWPGYTFAGWQLGDQVLEDGAQIENLASVEGEHVTLTALWKMTEDSYTVRFDANGGTGSMGASECQCGQGLTLPAKKFRRKGYTFAGWNTEADGTGTFYENKQPDVMFDAAAGDVVTLYAMWNGITYYVAYDGNGADSGSMDNSTHVYGTPGGLNANKFKKKGYTFAGWNRKANGTGTAYEDKEEVSDLAAKPEKTVTLYAQWKETEYTITYHLNNGKLAKNVRTSYTMMTPAFDLPTPSRSGYDFDGWYKEKDFKKRVSGVKQGTRGNLEFYAKWVKCSGKAKKTSAQITKCKATSKGTVKVCATIKNRVLSADDYYYLMYMNPVTKKAYKIAGKIYKGKKITYTLKTSQNQGYAVSMFGIAVKKHGSYVLISSPSFVGSVKKAAANTKAYKPGKTKKGIQYFDNVKDVMDSGSDQLFLNVTVSQVYNGAAVPYEYNGKTYYFGPMNGHKDIVKQCNKKGIVVTMQILLDWVPGQTDLITAEGRVQGAAPYYCWNVKNSAAREKMEAIFCYLGDIFGEKDCYVSNWILGNEVNSTRDWNYAGNMSRHKYFRTYAYAFRALYSAIKSQQANANIFICTDHYWNTAAPYGYSAKAAMQTFQKELDKIQKGVEWNLAFHPYSHPLTYTNVWEGYLVTNNDRTEAITMKNLKVLTNYMKRNYGNKKRIILSELGYTSSNGQEKNQAAAIAYSYYIAACEPMVDAIIFRSLKDHALEVAQGLSMGIKGKKAYRVFKYMDTSKSFTYTNKYLKMIGAKSWKKVIPRFQKTRITKMYRK